MNVQSPSDYPLSEWVSATIHSYVIEQVVTVADQKKLWKYPRLVGFRNALFLMELYEFDYRVIYKLRTHPDLSGIIMAGEKITDATNTGPKINHHEYWSDKTFSEYMIRCLVSGKVTFPGIEFTGELTAKLLMPLFSLTPPMLPEINIELNNQLFMCAAHLTGSLENANAEEIYISTEAKILDLITMKSEDYTTLYEHRDGKSRERFGDGLTFGYDLWFTSRGTPVVMTLLTDRTATEIRNLVERSAKSIHPNESLIITEDVVKASNLYNEILDNISFYNNEIEFTSLVDGFLTKRIEFIGNLKINDRAELLPEQMKLDGIMVVKAENKFIKAFTMREIGMGLPQRESSVFHSLSYDYEGVTKKPHSTTFEVEIRKMPDELEKYLINKVNEVKHDKVKSQRLKKVYLFFIKMALKEFLKTTASSSLHDLNEPVKKFIDSDCQPQLMNIYSRPLSDLIVLRGEGNENECRLLAISTLKGECRIISQDLWRLYNDKGIQTWLSDHLSAAHRSEEEIQHAYDRYRYGYHGNLGIPVLNSCPLNLVSTTDYLESLCERYVAKATSDADSYIKTSGEKAVEYLLDFISITTLTLSLRPAITALGQFIQLVLGTTVNSATQVVKFLKADSEDIKVNIFWEVFMGFISELVFNGLGVIHVLKQKLSMQMTKKLPFHDREKYNRLQRSLFEKGMLNIDYKQPSQLISKGITAETYQYGKREIIKDYICTTSDLATRPDWLKYYRPRAMDLPVQDRSFSYAYHNTVALNRIYGPGTAKLFIHRRAGELKDSVSVKMTRISGENLNSILGRKDRFLFKKIVRQLDEHSIEKISTNLINELKIKGISHNDINMGNILYDPKSGEFKLIDFDNAMINPVKDGTISPVNVESVKKMHQKLTGDLRDFAMALQGGVS